MVFWLWFGIEYVLNTPLAHYNSWVLFSLFINTDLKLLCLWASRMRTDNGLNTWRFPSIPVILFALLKEQHVNALCASVSHEKHKA